MDLQLDRFLKGAVASAFALVMVAGCNTIEGAGEDVAEVGQAIQRAAPPENQVELAGDWEDNDNWDRRESSTVHRSGLVHESARHEAGLFTADGRRIDAQQRQQMASSQMRDQSQQQLAQRSEIQRERGTDVFGFAEDQNAQNQQKLTGTIQDVARVPHITLKTEDGREVIALLRDDHVEQIQQLQQGQKVTISGSMREHEGQQVFMVQSVEKAQMRQADRAGQERNADQAFGFAADDRAKAEHAGKKHALVGTVEKIEEVQGNKGPHLMVRSDKGAKIYRVDLTGVEEARLLKTEINEGDKVTLIGSLVKADQQQQDQQNQQQQAHADAQQTFKAEKMHKGVHAEVIQTYGFVGEGGEHLSGTLSNLNVQAEAGASAWIVTADGKRVKVDLSQIDRAKLQGLNLQNDQPVTAMGSFEQKEGERVLVATDIKHGLHQEGQQRPQQDQQRQQDQPAQRSDQAPQNQPQP